MAANANPSQNPADNDTLKGALRLAFRKLMMSTDGMLPAKVVAVSADRNFVTVAPQIAIVATDQTVTQRAQIVRVPVLQMGGGNFVLSFPLKKDDLGWIIANDRDISAYIASGAATPPNTGRLKDFADAVFVSDKARQWTLDGDDADAVVLQSLDGSVKIALRTGEIDFAATVVKVIGELQVSQGIGFYGLNPAGKPNIVGALSAVTDANAKVVLTSIIAAITTGSGQASNGTT